MTEMLSHFVIISACLLYLAFLFMIALWVERKAAAGRDVGNNPVVYALSLTVYHTAWTFYGSVGKAASAGMLFITIYLGPTVAVLLWWIMLRKMVRIKDNYKITDIADFISLRYNRSPSIAALVTIISVVGIVPYNSLQLKAIFSTLALVTNFPRSGESVWTRINVEPVIVGLIILFTIVMGVRRLVPTERHQGVMVVIALEGLVKLAALLAVGIYVTYGLFGGFGDIFTRFANSPFSNSIVGIQATPSYYVTWFSYLLVSMCAVMFLPRQFHVAVVENFQEKHIAAAMWLLPLYIFLINLFVLPIALGGLLAGYPLAQADTFVLALPLGSGQAALSLLVFLGGFSAASGMIIISSMTVSTMVTNHLLLRVMESAHPLGFLKRYLLQCRWITVAVLIAAAFWFERNVGIYFPLVDIGLTSFVAVLQFAPAIIGGLFWKRGNAAGALLGMGSGFLLWIYTLILPAFARVGIMPRSLLEEGPMGFEMLRPEHLVGMTGLDPISHAVLWTMFFNAGLYVLGSLYAEQGQEERKLSAELVNSLAAAEPVPLSVEATIDLAAKTRDVEALFNQYFLATKAVELAQHCLAALQIDRKHTISIIELAELYNEAERYLAGSIGAAAAHKAIHKSAIMTPAEETALKQIYGEMVAELRMPPSDLKRRINYHREREKLLVQQATELEEKIKERDKEIAERKKAEEALRNSERRLADIIDFLPDATFVIDAEGKIIIWNRVAEEFTGAKAEEMLGKGNREYSIPFYGERRPVLIDLVFTPSEEIKRLYPHVVVEGGIVIGESVTRSVKRGKAYMLALAAPLYDSEGRFIGAIESVRDITERKQAEEELKKHRDHLEDLVRERTAELEAAKEKAEVANRAKSTFLSSMSHELRTPLNAILGYAQLLKRQNITERQRQQLDVIRTSGEHLLALIDEILDMGKIEASKTELEEVSFDPSALLRQVFNITKIRADEKDLTMQYEARTQLPDLVRGDERKLKQALLNLLTNAVKYTHRGGITLRVSYAAAGPGIFRCEVVDTGIGIPQDKLEMIFEPFTQLAAEGQIREGAGLGLSITKRLLSFMQGKIGVESELGKGSTFWVEVPLSAVSAGEVPAERTEQGITGYQGARKKILVVEDNVSNASVLVSMLEPLGFEVVTAENGREGVSQALELKPDLILLDLVMPEMDGLEAVRDMRQHRELDQTMIIGISATVTESARKEEFAAACEDFIAKPIGLELLLEKIGTQLDIVWERGLPEQPPVAAPQPAGEQPFEMPPPQDMTELYELAMRGDMRQIREWVDDLEERDKRYIRFAEKLRELTGAFKAKAILALVEHGWRNKNDP